MGMLTDPEFFTIQNGCHKLLARFGMNYGGI
jgi:hypothetical protein